MAMQAKTLKRIETVRGLLEKHHPMTLRQIFYRLVSLQVYKNTESQYQSLSKTLVRARKEGMIPWEWIEDRLRRPRTVSMWNGLADFMDTVRVAYRRNVWQDQPGYLEVWLEKDALSGIFEEVLNPYGVTLNVGRGYTSWSAIREAAERLPMDTMILYFGDFDPSGEDMVRCLEEGLAFFGCCPKIIKCALTEDDITHYNLPPDFTKKRDPRRTDFVDKYGDKCVELDALPPDVLERRLTEAIRERMDMEAIEKTRTEEKREIGQLQEFCNL